MAKRGRKPGRLWNGIKPKHIARDTIESRIRELVKRDDETSKKEACRLAVQLLPYEEPRLQAVMSQTTLEAGDFLRSLLKAIDGTTTGISRGLAAGGSMLAIEHALRDSGQDWETDPHSGLTGRSRTC